MNNEFLFESFPAFDVFGREPDSEGFVHINDDDVLCSGVRLYYTGNVWSYAMENGLDPEAAYNKAIENKNQIHWINSMCSVISNTDVKKIKTIKVYAGMKVIYMGKKFTIEDDWNNNLKLVKFSKFLTVHGSDWCSWSEKPTKRPPYVKCESFEEFVSAYHVREFAWIELTKDSVKSGLSLLEDGHFWQGGNISQETLEDLHALLNEVEWN